MAWGPSGNGHEWLKVDLTTVHRAVPAPGELAPVTASRATTPVIWVPPAPCYVRGVIVNDDENDSFPLDKMAIVATDPDADRTFVLQTSGYQFARGWGARGPQHEDSGFEAATASGGYFMFPAGAAPGRPNAQRALIALRETAGSSVGTLHWHLEYRLLPGGWS